MKVGSSQPKLIKLWPPGLSSLFWKITKIRWSPLSTTRRAVVSCYIACHACNLSVSYASAKWLHIPLSPHHWHHGAPGPALASSFTIISVKTLLIAQHIATKFFQTVHWYCATAIGHLSHTKWKMGEKEIQWYVYNQEMYSC